jgi:Holliday junction resolvasome RuvABC endonuclease subunit
LSLFCLMTANTSSTVDLTMASGVISAAVTEQATTSKYAAKQCRDVFIMSAPEIKTYLQSTLPLTTASATVAEAVSPIHAARTVINILRIADEFD